MDALYSLFDVDTHRLNTVVQHKVFTAALNFVLLTSTDDILPVTDLILDRFCMSILPKIDHNITSLIIESQSMERILRAAYYPNLTKLKIYNFLDKIAASYFTDTSPFRRIFQEQIIDLSLVYKHGIDILAERLYRNGVHGHVLTFFKSLQDLSITGLPSLLTLFDSPLTTCSSSTLSKLCVFLNGFGECLALLDGRLAGLTTLIVILDSTRLHSSTYNMDNLPNLKCFSLKCLCMSDEYDTQIVPLLRRMLNLQELTLNIFIQNRFKLVDGTQINNEIFIHMPLLQKFNFYIHTGSYRNDSIRLSSDEIRRTFANIGYPHMDCIRYDFPYMAVCHVFSLPFMFENFEFLGNSFPSIVFDRVTSLSVSDEVPFEHEFFVRLARHFPSLKELSVINRESQSNVSDQLNSQETQSFPPIEYPYLTSLSLVYANIDYVDQLLNQEKIVLPCLTKLEVNYDYLTSVTNNFTRDATRLNCAKVKELITEKSLVHSANFYVYFPLL
ncbi:unnamed protein product [Adineta ricciae]|uniref:Uncharacterized protein n=1 Tax=Adineta ricciae TaxID=249248 RepID=A0A815ALL1_ADIRI|nr:unnamed protein product [Adineta ricciae]